jgi:hypothetical protein
LKSCVIGLVMILSAAGFALAADKAPAGYLVTMKLAGEDAVAKEIVERNGAPLAAKLMMPLFDGDVVAVRDPASRVGVELGDGTTMTLGEGLARFELKGEIDTGDGTWGIIAAIGGVFTDEAAPAPENMAAKGASLKMPMAVRGANMIRKGRNSLWLAWEGGKAPYSVSILSGGMEVMLVKDQPDASISVPIEKVESEKFSIIVRDAEQQKLHVRLRFAATLPDGLPVTGSSQASYLATAGWLTGQTGWSIEAAQMLRAAGTDPALAMLEKVKAGWTFHPATP